MQPSKKSPAMENFLTSLLGGVSRTETIKGNRCVPAPIGCGGPAVEFTSELSRKEYSISGLCEKCQNEFFGS